VDIKKVFISGGCGFVGSYLARELVRQGCEVMLFDAFLNYIDPFTSNYQFFLKARMADLMGKVKVERGDLRVQKRMQQLLTEWKPEGVIHLAALPSAKESTMYPTEALQINVDGTLSLLEGVKACGSVRRFIFTSSSFVYGNFKKPIADEEHPTDPIDVYGGTKLTGEILTRSYSKQHGFEHVIIRPSAVYGFGDCNRRVTQILIENAMKGKPLILHDGGRSRIDFTYITDRSRRLRPSADDAGRREPDLQHHPRKRPQHSRIRARSKKALPEGRTRRKAARHLAPRTRHAEHRKSKETPRLQSED